MRTCLKLLAVTLAATGVACTVQDTPAPALTGPSEYALRIALTVSPDSILQDGASQAVLNIDASGPDGRPVRGLPLRVEILVNGTVFDFGTLSAKTVVTGDDGRARVIYTAPPRPAEPVENGTVVTFLVTPIGTDFRGEVARQVDLRLVTPGVIQPPNIGAPQPQFTFAPSNPQVLQNVVFDASTTTDVVGRNSDGSPIVQPCGPSCTYRWDFGDGTTATGIFANHSYREAGTYQVRLTVTDDQGATASIAKSITVGAGTPPSGSFTFSPTAPAINQTVLFDASAVRAATGRRIVSYEWNFGNGRGGSGVTTSTSYSQAGTFNVTLTVTDDAGTQATFTQSITVGGSGNAPTAVLEITPRPPVAPGVTLFFDASGSRPTPGPNTIVEYRFGFGDGTTEVTTTAPYTSHAYSAPGTYVATLAVRDSAGRTSPTIIREIVVAVPTPPGNTSAAGPAAVIRPRQ